MSISPLFLFTLIEVRPRVAGARKRDRWAHSVVAQSPEEAIKAVQVQSCGLRDASFFKVDSKVAVAAGLVVESRVLRGVSEDEFAKLQGNPVPAVVAKPSSSLASRPLTASQQGVLLALLEHGKWPGGWIWNTHSGTLRICEALCARGLAEKKDDKFFITEDGRRALEQLTASDTRN